MKVYILKIIELEKYIQYLKEDTYFRTKRRDINFLYHCKHKITECNCLCKNLIKGYLTASQVLRYVERGQSLVVEVSQELVSLKVIDFSFIKYT